MPAPSIKVLGENGSVLYVIVSWRGFAKQSPSPHPSTPPSLPPLLGEGWGEVGRG